MPDNAGLQLFNDCGEKTNKKELCIRSISNIVMKYQSNYVGPRSYIKIKQPRSFIIWKL